MSSMRQNGFCAGFSDGRNSARTSRFIFKKRFGQIVASCKGLSVLERPEQHSEKPMSMGRPFIFRPKDVVGKKIDDAERKIATTLSCRSWRRNGTIRTVAKKRPTNRMPHPSEL